MKFDLDSIAVVLDSDNAVALSEFYSNLLGWERVPFQPDDEWIVLFKGESLALVFQQVDDYKRPVWPCAPGEQQQMTHLDFYVENPQDAVEHALACGAVLSDVQEGFWKVMIDPAGHPFCILPKRNQ